MTDNGMREMQHEEVIRRTVRTILKYVVVLIVAGGGVLAASTMLTKVPGEEMLAGNTKRNSAVYVKMSDGTQSPLMSGFPNK